MNISVIDGSNYFKGLLLLIGKDRKITDSEIELMRRVGKALGFEKEFYENAIHELLENTYIEDIPPTFSTSELAVRFIKDGLSLAYSDDELHSKEEEWLRLTAQKNGLTAEWFNEERDTCARRLKPGTHLEVDDLTVKYF
jgi:hypothetical protein